MKIHLLLGLVLGFGLALALGCASVSCAADSPPLQLCLDPSIERLPCGGRDVEEVVKKQGEVPVVGQAQVGRKVFQWNSGSFGVVDLVDVEEQLLDDVHEAGFREVCHDLHGKRESRHQLVLVLVLSIILTISRSIVFFGAAVGRGGYLVEVDETPPLAQQLKMIDGDVVMEQGGELAEA